MKSCTRPPEAILFISIAMPCFVSLAIERVHALVHDSRFRYFPAGMRAACREVSVAADGDPIEQSVVVTNKILSTD